MNSGFSYKQGRTTVTEVYIGFFFHFITQCMGSPTLQNTSTCHELNMYYAMEKQGVGTCGCFNQISGSIPLIPILINSQWMSLLLSSEVSCGLFIRSLLPGDLRLTHQLLISSPAPLGMMTVGMLSPSLSTEQHFKGKNYLVELETWFFAVPDNEAFFPLGPTWLWSCTGGCAPTHSTATVLSRLFLWSARPRSCPSLWHRMESRVLGWPPELLSLKQKASLLECYHLFHSSHRRRDYIFNQHCALWYLCLFQPEEFNALRHGK